MKTVGMDLGLLLSPEAIVATVINDDYIGREVYQFRRRGTNTVEIGKAKVDPQVAAFHPAEFCKGLPECSQVSF